MKIAIHYADESVVVVSSRAQWRRARSTGVQVVVAFDGVGNATCREDGSLIDDRSLWTGDDEYDPFGWGVKYGSLIEDDLYWRIWRRACDDG